MIGPRLAGGPVAPAPFDTAAKVNPPLRTEADVEAVIEGLKDGTIDCIATDHAPHALEDKLCEFDLAANGISGFETALGAVLSLVHRGVVDLPLIISRMTWEPARILRREQGAERKEGVVPEGLGTLAVGAPGDVTVIDPDAEWVVEPEKFVSRGKNTPLAGVALKGKVVATFYGGVQVHGQGSRRRDRQTEGLTD
jgi:dihydroorotase